MWTQSLARVFFSLLPKGESKKEFLESRSPLYTAQVAQIENNSKKYTTLETWWTVYSPYEYMIVKRRANSVVQFSKKMQKTTFLHTTH